MPTLVDYLNRLPIKLAFLHGSAAEGLPFADLDIACLAREPVDPLDFILEHGANLEKKLGVPVDLHLLNQAPIGFRFHATRGQVLVSEDEVSLADWKEATWNDYFRNQYFFDELRRHLLNRG